MSPSSIDKFNANYFASYPEEVAQILIAQSSRELSILLQPHSAPVLARLMEYWPASFAQQLFTSFSREKKIEVLESASVSVAVQQLRGLENAEQDELLQALPQYKRVPLEEFLQFFPDSLGSLCEAEFLTAWADDSLSLIRKLIESNPKIFNDYVYLESQTGPLEGVISFREIFLNSANSIARRWMKTPVTSFSSKDLIEAKLYSSAWTRFSAVPILSRNNMMIGIVRSKRIHERASSHLVSSNRSMEVAANAIGETFWVGLSGMATVLSSMLEKRKGED